MGWRDWFRAKPAAAPRRTRVYGGARLTRLESDWFASQVSADQAIKQSLRTLRNRSRQLHRDNAHVAAFVHLLETNVIGPHGIRLQNRARNREGVLREGVNARIEAAWADWGRVGNCDVTGRLSWVDVQHLLIGNLALDGELLARRRIGPQYPHGYALQLLDPDLLDETLNVPPLTPGGNEIRMGVEVTSEGRPVRYHLLTAHPSEGSPAGRRHVRLGPDEILHCFISTRPGQTRGVPWLAPVMLTERMLSGYREAEITAARGAAAKPVFYKQDPETVYDSDGGDIAEEIEPAMAHLLPPGVDPVMLDPTHPNGGFKEFEKAILRTIATGLGVSYASLASDLEAANYSSMRGGLLQERDHYERLQMWFADHVHAVVFRDWLPVAAAAGQVEVPLTGPERAAVPEWHPRVWQWVDPLKDMKAEELSLRLGVQSRTRLCKAMGVEFADVLEELVAEEALATEKGYTLPALSGPPGGGNDGTDALTLDDPDEGGRGGDGRSHPRGPLLRVAG